MFAHPSDEGRTDQVPKRNVNATDPQTLHGRRTARAEAEVVTYVNVRSVTSLLTAHRSPTSPEDASGNVPPGYPRTPGRSRCYLRRSVCFSEKVGSRI